MAVPQGDFSKLLRELRSAGPVDRVRLLAKSLAALRGLSPWDRKVLLRMAGFEGAEALVERLAQEDEATARKLRGLLRELEGRPEEMERTVRALADPKRRGEALDELLTTLDRGLGTEAGEPAGEPKAPEAPQAAELPPVPQAPPVPEPSPVPEPPPVPERGVRLEPPFAAPPPARPGAAQRAPVKPAPEPARARVARPQEVEPPVPEPEPAPAARAEPRSEEAAAPEPRRAPAAIAEAPPPAPAAVSAAMGLARDDADGSPRSAARILDRLLELRRRIAAGEVPDARELRRALETEIPFPWARRRALAAWLAAGPSDLGEALGLIEELPGASDRSWCLGALAEAGPWSEREWERIVAAAPTAAARRRLENRRNP